MARVYKLPGIYFIFNVFCFLGFFNILIQVASADSSSVGGILEPKFENAPAETTTKPPFADLCPSRESIYPCTCTSSSIQCIGSTFTPISQETINNAMAEIREVNGLAIDDLFSTDKQFELLLTTMTSLDLSPFLNSQFASIRIAINEQLSQIHGPKPSDYLASIHVQDLYLDRNNLTDKGLGDSLRYFAPSLVKLDLSSNLIEGQSASSNATTFRSEFLPGLDAFVNLQQLLLGKNRIPKIQDAPFKALRSLKSLDVGCVGEVGENAILIDQTSAPAKRVIAFRHYIQCQSKLSDEKFHANHGFALFTGLAELDLGYMEFEFLAREKFEPFLEANRENVLYGVGNPFICDQRMKWLKDGRRSYEQRVWDVDCINDPGNTIFTTDLV